jgi:hypothetical protein
MVIASFFALVMAAAAADEPVATSPTARPAQAPAAVSAPAPTGPPRDAEIPASAPGDDYGFVAWCHGALSGHMELHDRVKPELDKVSPGGDDTELAKAGTEYLSLYAAALKEAEAASPQNIHDRGVEANAAGYRIWAAARAAEPRTQMWSYLMWELPPRCEIAAKRLEQNSSLLGQALRSDTRPPPGPVGRREVAPAPSPETPTAGSPPAPAEPAAPVIGLRGAK